MAQACAAPAYPTETSTTLGREEILWGVAVEVTALGGKGETPSWPCEFNPQQWTVPGVVRAHTVKLPQAICATSIRPSTRRGAPLQGILPPSVLGSMH